jgi:hypothetical protein
MKKILFAFLRCSLKKIRMKNYIVISLFMLIYISVNAQTIVTYPGPSTLAAHPDISVKAGGKDVFVYNAKVGNYWDGHNGYPWTDTAKIAMAYFDFDGGSVPVEIVVKNQSTLSSVQLLPDNKGVVPTVTGNKISFTLNSHQKFFIRINNSIQGSVMLFTAPILPRPNINDPNLVYYGPGEHFIGGNGRGNITLNSNQTLFIDGGAVVHGYIVVPERNNVSVTGRGILDGSYIPHKYNNGQPFVGIRGGDGIRMSGIILQNSPHWTVVPARAKNLMFDDVKIVNHRINSDGIDPVNSQGVVIKNCFISVGDDCISPKGCTWGFTYPGSADQNQNYQLKDISVTNCVLWTNVAGYALSRIGDESRTDTIKNLVFEDNDVISARSPFGINVYDRAYVKDVLVENLRLNANFFGYFAEVTIGTNEYSKDATRGFINGVYLRNILSKRHPNTSPSFTGYDANHKIKNITFEGVLTGSNYENKLVEQSWWYKNAYYENIKFIDGGTTPGQVYNRYVKNISKTSATVSWEKVPGYLSYELRYRAKETSNWTVKTGTEPAGVSLTGLSPATTYEWQIRTLSSAGTHEWSLVQVFTTQNVNTGIGNIRQSKTAIYPNPSKDGVFTLMGENMENTQIFITDVMGRTVPYQTMEINSQKRIIQLLRTNATGLFLLTATDGVDFYHKKILWI